MKLRSFLFIGLIALAIGFGSSTALAQATVMRVEIPFDFVVGKRTLPAGNYDVKLKETGGSPYVIVRSEDGEHVGLALVGPVNGRAENAESELAFVRSGEKHFLSGLKVAGRNVDHQLVPSKLLRGTQLADRAIIVKPVKS